MATPDARPPAVIVGALIAAVGDYRRKGWLVLPDHEQQKLDMLLAEAEGLLNRHRRDRP